MWCGAFGEFPNNISPSTHAAFDACRSHWNAGSGRRRRQSDACCGAGHPGPSLIQLFYRSRKHCSFVFNRRNGTVVVRRTTRLWTGLRAFARRHRVHLALSIRVTIAALVSLALAQRLGLPLPLWAVLTAVIVTQMSVGRSLMATFDYLVGTLGGAIYGGAIGVLIPHSSEIALLAVLALAVTPLALIAAINPKFSVAPITAIIVLLIPTMTHASPFASAFDRVIEVALGGVTGLVVSFVLLPSKAHPLVVEAAARTLERMAQALGELLAGLTRGLDVEALHRIQDGIGQALVKMNAVGDRGGARAVGGSHHGARHGAAVAHTCSGCATTL